MAIWYNTRLGWGERRSERGEREREEGGERGERERGREIATYLRNLLHN